MFPSLLIANRGEIACRIIRTAQRLGIKTIAVYAQADANAQHVKLADQAIYIGPAAPEQSYLHLPAIIQAAQQSHAHAIHPGYGFLSENVSFAQACEDHHLIFVGPSIQALKIMGSKQQAKTHLEKLKIPLIPGYHGTQQDQASLVKASKKIGLPLLIKAAAGGGGKGMRVVTHLDELPQAIDAAKREANAYFGDSTLILETFFPKARHVEVQLMGDHSGNIVPLFDRDCSIQRRHQKIIEEAPAPFLSDRCHATLAQTACDIGRAIHYTNAGTVEFLVTPDERIYFMEMNTRLQVEHPVTEAITGLDLVEWQLRIANQERLPPDFSTLTSHGHALECRVYAEDPSQHFLPSTGEIYILETPNMVEYGVGTARVDSGYQSGDSLTPHYDALIAKLITHGDTREQTIQLMQQALKHYLIGGVQTNLAFLQALCKQPAFIQGELSTDFLDTHPIALPSAPPLPVLLLLFADHYVKTLPTDPIEQDCIGWPAFAPRCWQQTFQYQQTCYHGQYLATKRDAFTLTLAGETFHLQVIQTTPTLMVHTGSLQYQGQVVDHAEQWCCFYEGITYPFHVIQYTTGAHDLPQSHAAPMPGTVVALLKQKGDVIEAAEGVMIIEAMKMEHTIRAAHAGYIEEIFFQPGEQVTEGTQLFILKDPHVIKKSDAH